MKQHKRRIRYAEQSEGCYGLACRGCVTVGGEEADLGADDIKYNEKKSFIENKYT